MLSRASQQRPIRTIYKYIKLYKYIINIHTQNVPCFVGFAFVTAFTFRNILILRETKRNQYNSRDTTSEKSFRSIFSRDTKLRMRWCLCIVSSPDAVSMYCSRHYAVSETVTLGMWRVLQKLFRNAVYRITPTRNAVTMYF